MTDERWQVHIIRSNRKTMCLEITKDGSLLVRAPYRMPVSQIRSFLDQKSEWIDTHLRMAQKRMEEIRANPGDRLTLEEIRELADRALKIIPGRVEFYARKLQVTYGRITIRNQKSRWGSCSGKGNLNFNCLLMLAPSEVLDYVVVHELCHRKEMNHSERFWSEVERILPDYREQKKWLRENGGKLISRMEEHES